jgi:hypothetical protein
VRTDILPATGTSVWTGAALASGNSGIHHLDAVELAEIDTALRRLRGLGAIDLPAITMAHFPLFRCRDFLGRALLELRHGLGFLLLRGLPRDRYDADDMARIYFGLGTYLGACLPQSYLGELLGNVVDVSDVEADARGYHAGGGQRMHTDTCDIVSLMCLRAARTGGASRISSAMAVHNELLRARPDLLELLYEGYVCRRMELDARHGDGALVRHRAMYARQGDEVWCNISGSYPRRAAAAGDAIMSSAQVEALDEIQRLAGSPDFYLDMSIGEGDIQFLNNRLILHGRTDYEDWPEIARRRHMLRLWLSVPSWPALPANQGMHTPADHAGWLRQRRPLMELPSQFLVEMTRRKAEQAA